MSCWVVCLFFSGGLLFGASSFFVEGTEVSEMHLSNRPDRQGWSSQSSGCDMIETFNPSVRVFTFVWGVG